MTLEKLKKQNIPIAPGCYQFLNRKKEIIYIGKAANLRGRVFSYWQKSANHAPAKRSMLRQIEKVEWVETESEIEAILLEANLIKKYQPQYNIVMRDDKRHVYIKISTEEKWPRIFMARNLDKTGRYFGPFVSAEAVKIILKAIRKIWPYRTCARMPKRVCLYYSLRKCPGMCEKEVSKKDYQKIIKQIILFLEGKKKKIVKGYSAKIKELEKKDAQSQEAKILKYQLINIKKILEQSNPLSSLDKYASDTLELAKVIGLKIEPKRIEGYDIANIFGKAAVGAMVVFHDGIADKNEYRKFKIKISQGEANDVGMLKEVLERRFKNNWALPELIIIDGGKAQLNAGIRVLKKFKLDIPIISISKGEGLRSAGAPDKLFFPGEKKPLELRLNSPALHLLKRARDEAHRFALSYHRKLRGKNVFKRE